MVRNPQVVMVTGGCGFIGSNLIHYVLDECGFDGVVVNVDKLTYAGSQGNLQTVERRHGDRRYHFYRADVCDTEAMGGILTRHSVDTIIHLAAETHVDRSILNPQSFVGPNVQGTCSLLSAANREWDGKKNTHFHHVSTDEVFGELGEEGRFSEETPYAPRSPYSASKAASDHFVRAFHHTYGLSTTISNTSNNFGPYQFPEKLIPLMILNVLDRKPLPVYGSGKNVRDWLYVKDHASAIWSIVTSGVSGESYNVGGDSEWRNLDLVKLLCRKIAVMQGKDASANDNLVSFVADRPGHDYRYSIDSSKIMRELGWKRRVGFEAGLEETIRWYMTNPDWGRSARGRLL
jgi:dTDP-glucose 4,6-dehydratase